MQRLFNRLSLTLSYLALDFACVILSVFLAYGTYHLLDLGQEVVYDISFLMSFALILAAAVCLVMYKFGAYYRDSGILNVREIRSVILGVLTGLVLVNALFFAVRFMPSRYFIFLCFGYMLLLLPLARSVYYSYLTRRLPKALVHRVLIYGAGELGCRLFREIRNSPRMHIQVVGFVDDDPAKRPFMKTWTMIFIISTTSPFSWTWPFCFRR